MLQLSRAVVRSFSTAVPQRSAAKVEVDKGYAEIKKIQEHFQKPDGKPIFLKGSTMDSVLYRVTMGLSLVGLGGIIKLFYELSVPKKE